MDKYEIKDEITISLRDSETGKVIYERVVGENSELNAFEKGLFMEHALQSVLNAK